MRVTHSIFYFYNANDEVSIMVSLVIEVALQNHEKCAEKSWEDGNQLDIISPFFWSIFVHSCFSFSSQHQLFKWNKFSFPGISLGKLLKIGAFKKLNFVVKHGEVLFLVVLILIKWEGFWWLAAISPSYFLVFYLEESWGRYKHVYWYCSKFTGEIPDIHCKTK